MRILYIFGNGFDIAQGLKTKYQDFYKYLDTKVDSSSPVLLQKMIKKINENVENWSDMEKKLGEFTKETESVEDFTVFYDSLSDYLREYLQSEYSKYNPSDAHKAKIRKNIISISNGLEGTDKEIFNNWGGGQDRYLAFISFNYTNTLEDVLDLKGEKWKTEYNIPPHANGCIHVHGILEEENPILIGVDNVEQIANEQFRNNEDIKDFLIKVQSNKAIKENRTSECENLIIRADVIVLYGVSLGDTDERWWKFIGQQIINRGLRVIYHAHRDDLPPKRHRYKIGKIIREIEDKIIQNFGVSKGYAERILISINSDIFDIE